MKEAGAGSRKSRSRKDEKQRRPMSIPSSGAEERRLRSQDRKKSHFKGANNAS